LLNITTKYLSVAMFVIVDISNISYIFVGKSNIEFLSVVVVHTATRVA
jgi:hypothetical protein